MNRPTLLLAGLLLPAALAAAEPKSTAAVPAKDTPPPAALLLREIRYDGRLTDNEARFVVDIDAESTGKGEASLTLFEGDVALLPAKLPVELRIGRDGNRYLLTATRPGKYRFKLELVAKIQRAEPWNQVSFTGPPAVIAAVTAQAGGAGMEVQLLGGTLLETTQTNGVSHVKGFLAADQTVALRWQSKVAEVARKALITVDTTASAQITPTVIRYTTQFRYEIMQGNAARLTLALPATHALTRLVGEQIRDWQLKVGQAPSPSPTSSNDVQILTVEFIKPVEKQYNLTLYTEQTVETTPATAQLNPPQPLEVERESGAFTLSAEDTLVEIDSLSGLRQVNVTGGALAAYRFNGRPFALALKLRRIEPVLNVADRVSARLEETRLLVSHALTLTVEKAGIYALELSPPPGFVVADVRGDGVEDWKVADGPAADRKVLRVSFPARLLGTRRLDVQLEQALKTFPGEIVVAPLRVTAAAKETAQIGAAAAPGIRLKTAELNGLREIPVRTLPRSAGGTPALPADELLAFTTEQPDWRLTLASERLAARVVAEVFNLVTIGDGLVGGSATIRFGLVNQGVQEFKVKVPVHCRNVEFTGANIRRKEPSPRAAGADTNHVVWTIGLQDKVWGGYTLVVTYDHQFDPKGATLPIGGIHTVDVERETGSVAVTTAASLKLGVKSVGEPLRRVDEFELAAADRALVTRSVLLAYQYTGDQYDLAVEVQKHEEERVLEAVADRTQITSVLTEAGEMLTQASFMVKNNEKQFQRFQLPRGADLWSCYVNGQPAKPERDADWVLVSLPRDVNRDQAFAVDIVYAQTNSPMKARWLQTLQLVAPSTDVPNTYAEWQLYVPASLRLSRFGGSMSVAQGTTYGMLDAWQKFLAFYGQVIREAGASIVVLGALALLVLALVISAVRRGWSGILTVLAVFGVLAVLAGMLLPTLSKAKSRAKRISVLNNLKQIGLGAMAYAEDYNGRLPVSFQEIKAIKYITDDTTIDPESGQPLVYLGGGMLLNSLQPDSVLAYSPIFNDRCSVLFADGHVEQVTSARFAELAQRGLVQVLSSEEIAAKQQRDVIERNQFANRPPAAVPPVRERLTASTPGSDGGRRGGVGGGTVTFANQAPPAVDLAAEAPVTGLPAGGRGGRGGGVGGGGGGRGGGFAGPAVAAPAAPLPMAAGIRSIRIDIPRTGNAFLFTKVLNVGREPLSIQARIMSLHTFQTMQMAGQVAAFVLGLLVWWWQWSRHGGMRRNSFILTLALALVIVSVCSLLIAWRALHDLLIIGFPVVTLAAIAYLIWKYLPRHRASVEDSSSPPAEPAGGLPPAITAIGLLLSLAVVNSQAAEPPEPVESPTPPGISILSANYTGTANDRVAQLDATLQVSATKAGQTIRLFGGRVAVEQFTAKGDAQLIRDGNIIAVRLNQRGDAKLQIKMLVPVVGDVTKRHLWFNLPVALSSQFNLTLDQPGVEVESPTAVLLKRRTDQDHTYIEVVVGSEKSLQLFWTPRVKRAAEVAATVFCQNTALVSFGGGVVNVRSTLDYQVTQGELRQARVRLPAGQRLLRAEGEAIRTWEIKEDSGGQILAVDLLKAISPAYQLTVETERMLETLPATVKVETPHALDVSRETGLVALRGGEELSLAVESAKELQRVDAEEFARASTQKADGLMSVFRFLRPDFDLRARAETVQPQVEAVVRNNVRVGADQMSLASVIDYTIKRAGVFGLKVALPTGYRVERVVGNNVLQWAERTEGEARLLEVTLKERTSGAYTLRIELAKNFKELPKSLTIEGVHPLGTAKLTGFVSVAAEPGVATKTETFDGLTEIPAISLPDYGMVSGAGSVLAYKFIAPEPKSVPEWKLTVATEAVEPWLRAEVVNILTLTETLVSGRALVRYDIANAPMKEVRLKIPAAFKNVEVSGPNIRRRDQTNEEWRVELQSQTRGFYTLTVTWEQPRAGNTNSLELAGVTAAGVERETGLLAIVARPPLQVAEIRAQDLSRVDARDFPEWAGRANDATVLAYRYIRPGYTLVLEAKRFDEAEVLQALIDGVRLTTVVADDGQMMTEMSLELRNNSRQFLEIELPPGTTVWSAFVAGQAVRPSRREGRLLLPLEQSGAEDAPVTVALTYVGTNTFPQIRGPVGFASPKLDVPLKNARWELFLPPDYGYRDFSGTMVREVVTAKPSLFGFTLSEYGRLERESQSQSRARAVQDLAKAKAQLSTGNVREANFNIQSASNRRSPGGPADAEVEQLKRELSTMQGSNLIAAQNEFNGRNAVRLGQEGQVLAGVTGGPQLGVRYDNSTAEAQWVKLQQAQEGVAARVQPLHVNLPTRGLRYAFTQVLQTKVNQPMTIQLLAANTKTGNWPMRIGLGLVSFLALWAVVAVVAARKRA